MYENRINMYENRTIWGFPKDRIMELFLDLKRHYFAEIAKRTGLTRPRTLRALRKLTEAGILKTESEANLKYYSLNKSPLVYSLLGMVEYNRAVLFLEKNKTLRRALGIFNSKYKEYLIMLVFGSRVKGYASKISDTDLLLIKEEFSKKDIRKIEALIEIINGRTGLRVSPYLMGTEEFRQKKDFVKEVMDNHIIIDGAELFFRLIME